MSCIYMLFGWNSDEWNGIEEDKDSNIIDKFFNRLYFTSISFSTIGYGDISPKSFKLRLITILFSFIVLIELHSFIVDGL